MDKEELADTEVEDSRELLPYASFLQMLREILKEMKEEEETNGKGTIARGD